MVVAIGDKQVVVVADIDKGVYIVVVTFDTVVETVGGGGGIEGIGDAEKGQIAESSAVVVVVSVETALLVVVVG